MITEKEILKERNLTVLIKEEILRNLETNSETLAKQLNKKIDKKVSFYLEETTEMSFVKKKKFVKRREKKSVNRRKKNRQNYKRNKKKKKRDRLKVLVDKIKDENVVVNLSNEEVPASAYLFLAKGLGFVPKCKFDPQDLKYDTLEFIRKLEWKAFFYQNPEIDNHSNQQSLN